MNTLTGHNVYEDKLGHSCKIESQSGKTWNIRRDYVVPGWGASDA